MRNEIPRPARAGELEKILLEVSRPGRYLGNEFNVRRKEWDAAALRFALVFPDLYEIGMSHQGLQILYHIINSRGDLLAERCCCPAPDMEERLRSRGIALFSLESRHSLAEFDILGMTLPYELCYTNILTILDLAGIPLYADERGEEHPLVIGGGPCAFHPEPVADFFDAILVGDGEEAVLEIADAVIAARKEGLDRKDTLARLARINGVYVPAFFEPGYGGDGRFTGMKPLGPGMEKVRRRVLSELGPGEHLKNPLVPLTRVVHDRHGVEVARGCTRGCRFCQAGIIYRPARERSPEDIISLARAGVENGGYEELALLSLSTGDYSCLPGLLCALVDEFLPRRVSLSMPSMRVGTLTAEVMEEIKKVRKTGFTLAPEAGSERLRQVINKGITEEDLMAACRAAFDLGWKHLKFYFMFGLPTERDEDLDAIAELVKKAARQGRGGRINVSVATFVPKPHTPFQREPQLSVEEGRERIDRLKKMLPRRGFTIKWHDPRMSWLEGVMSRGDRRLSRLIETAWRNGARLDAWSDWFDDRNWKEAADQCGIGLDEYLGARRRDEPLPWDHIDSGVDPEFIEKEYERALAGEYTPDCRYHGCQKCGLCDFKTVMPRVASRSRDWVPQRKRAETGYGAERVENGKRFAHVVTYSRTGPARFCGHLEVVQMFYRALRRARLPLAFSQGFNPIPKLAFGPALPVGTGSLAEFFVFEATRPVKETGRMIERLNSFLPEGFRCTGLALAASKMPDKFICRYLVRLPMPVDGKAVEDFLGRGRVELTRKRKGRERTFDIRPLVRAIRTIGEDEIEIELAHESSRPGVRPDELVRLIFAMDNAAVRQISVTRTWCDWPQVDARKN